MTIAIVGAGPVGLWTAIQIKLRNPRADISVFEQYVDYKRKHVIKLQYTSILLFAHIRNTGFFNLLAKDLLGVSVASILNEPLKSQFISTKVLESVLKRLAGNLGIHIQYKRIESFIHLKNECPNVTAAIFADGAKSALRADVFGDQCIDKKDLQYVVEVKYELHSSESSILPLADAVLEKSQLRFMAFEYIGRPVDEKHPVTLRLFVDKETFDSIPENSHKAPLNLDYGVLPENLYADIKTLMRCVEATGGGRSGEAVSITTLILSVYAASEFSKMHNGVPCYLVGDAAIGVPYFRALNSGFLLGSRLARFITRQKTPWLTKNSTAQSIRSYEKYRSIHVASEFATAMTKDKLLRMYANVRKFPAWIYLYVLRFKNGSK